MNDKKSKTGMMAALIIFMVSVIAFSCKQEDNRLQGRWSILNPDGSASGEYVDFNQDSTYNVTLPNGQVGERGKYMLADSVFSIKNIKDVCGKDYWGKYSLTFHGSDSVHLALIEDTCTSRRMDLVGYNPGLKRVKTK